MAPFYDLVNIKMYPQFEHGLGMALGDEFDGDNINAFQLADFADSCQLPRSLVAKRLKYIIGKLTLALQEEIKINLINEKEKAYLKKYQEIVIKRCKHLIMQCDLIMSIKVI